MAGVIVFYALRLHVNVDRVVAKAVISRTSGVSGMTMPATLSAAVVDKCTP
jgi:hypothetical protein